MSDPEDFVSILVSRDELRAAYRWAEVNGDDPGEEDAGAFCAAVTRQVPDLFDKETAIHDSLENALASLESAAKILDDSDVRSDPLSWIIDRLTEMSVIGAELDPWWYESVPKGSGAPGSVTRLSN